MRDPITAQAVTRLAGQHCVNPSCNNKITARAIHHLCWKCDAHWRRFVVPVAGFMPSGDLKVIAKAFLDDLKPTSTDTAAALQIIRGTRHRTGDWSERPAYRLQPLLHGRWNTRLPHLLVGRRTAPTLKVLIKSVVHWHLANQIIGTGAQYSKYLAGSTFYERRSPIAPKGAEVLRGDRKTPGYRLTVVDFSTIGQVCLRAAGELGFDPRSREVSDRLVSLYAQGVASGDCRGPVVAPFGTFATRASGDHSLDHTFSPLASVPARYKGAVRRASGLIKGQWPEGIDLSWEERNHLSRQPKPNPYSIKTTTASPDTGWVFGIE